GRTWARVDDTGSWTANILFIVASVLTLIPLLGLLIAVVLVPLLLVVFIVLLVRLSHRRGQVVYGTSIIKRNLIVTSAYLVLASIGGGYQIVLAVAKIVGSQWPADCEKPSRQQSEGLNTQEFLDAMQ